MARLRRVLRGLIFLGLAVFLALAMFWVLQRRFTYFPSQALPGVASVLAGAEEVSFSTDDGLVLKAWLVTAARPGDGATVVVFNGNAGNRVHRAPLAEALAERGYGVLLIDYRGYGGNPGSPSEPGLAADARGAVAYLEARSDVDSTRLIYFGESLGAAVALGLSEHRPPAALVLRSPFTSLPDIGATHYPFLPTSLMLWDRFPSLEVIPGIEVPLLVVAGSADTIVPIAQSRRLFQAASEPKRFVVIEGADHNDFELLAGQQLITEVVGFLDGVAKSDRWDN
jgi:uncharacterized protein